MGDGTTGPFFGVNVPQAVCAVGGCASGTLSGITAIAGGAGNASLAITSAGTVLACGDNADGQLGDGTTTQATLPTPASIRPGPR